MYEPLMHILRQFLGRGFLYTALVAAGVLVVITLAARRSPAFREGVASFRERRGWRAVLVDLGGGVFSFLLLILLARLLITAMVYEAGVFAHEHGRVTDRNRSAVLMKWGLPHEQRELTVTHTRKRTWVTRQMKVDEEHGKVFTQSFWKDDAPPVAPVNGKLPIVLGTRDEERDVPVEQKSIVSADIEIAVRNNPRRLGNANYAGYDDTWKFRYVITNRYEGATTAHLFFPLPAETGLFNEMYLRVEGGDTLDAATSRDDGIAWEFNMPAGARRTVEIGYRSRGLEHLRYIPRRMSQTGHYRVKMLVTGVPPGQLDYPIGSMPPAEDISSLRGREYTLTWTLDNALTSYDIGIKLPVAKQPEYHFARLLGNAPTGLILLLVLLALPRLVAGSVVRPGIVTVLALAYFLHYTFMGRLADLLTFFWGPFLISTALLVSLVSWFRVRDRDDALYFRVQDVLAFSIMAIHFPLAVIDSARTEFWMEVFYVGILLYTCILFVRCRILAHRTGRCGTAAPGPASG